MKAFLRNLLGIVFLLTGLFYADSALGQEEKILNYHSDIKLSSNNVLLVTEKIKVEAGGYSIKRGIYRVLPENKSKSNPLKNVSYDIISVKKDGKKEPYHIKKEKGNTVVYIGDNDVLLRPGQYEYELQYQTVNQVGFFYDYDELYWNVTGNEWAFRIDSVSATIHLPAAAKILQYFCYTGYTGSKEKNCTAKKLSDTVIKWTAANLNPNEGLTVAVGFPKNIIAQPPPPGFWQKNGLLLFAVVISFLLLVYYFITWNKYGRDPDAPTVYPQFESPDAISPAILGYVNNEYFKKEFITSSVVNLAVKGYLKINESEKKALFGLIKNTNFSLVKLKNADASLPAEESVLLSKLFTGSDDLQLTGTYDPNIKSAVTAFTSSIKSQFYSFINKGNNKKLILIPAVILFVSILLIALLDRLMIDREFPLLLFAAVGGVTLFAISFSLGFLYRRFFARMLIVAIIEIGVLLYLSYYVLYKSKDYALNNPIALAILLLFGAASIMFYIYLIRKPSPEKLKLQSLIKGFEMYLGAAEEQQLQFFNPPRMTPEVFEKFLPYAMVLGVDKIWGEKFNHLMESAAIDTSHQYKSSWYSGTNLSVGLFSGSLHSSLSNSIIASSTPPSSSGSGGGGSSGGGGGGGGGGGW